MKTDWPKPYNPENLPLAPGYRWLGQGEVLIKTDECLYTSYTSDWGKTSFAGYAVGQQNGIVNTRWSYRRALNIDDPFCPPPADFSDPKWHVFVGGTEPRVKGIQAYCVDSDEKYAWINCSQGPQNTYTDYYYRIPIAQPPINQPSVPMPIKPNASVIVKCTSMALAQAVLSAGQNMGWKSLFDCVSSSSIPACIAFHQIGTEAANVQESSEQWWREHKPDAIYLDARTDMGRLIDLLEEMKKPAIIAPKVNGYEGAYIKGGDTIKFGCAEIDISLIRDASNLLNRVRLGNRTVRSANVTLSSGVVLIDTHINAICTYVDAVNKA